MLINSLPLGTKIENLDSNYWWNKLLFHSFRKTKQNSNKLLYGLCPPINPTLVAAFSSLHPPNHNCCHNPLCQLHQWCRHHHLRPSITSMPPCCSFWSHNVWAASPLPPSHNLFLRLPPLCFHKHNLNSLTIASTTHTATMHMLSLYHQQLNAISMISTFFTRTPITIVNYYQVPPHWPLLNVYNI